MIYYFIIEVLTGQVKMKYRKGGKWEVGSAFSLNTCVVMVDYDKGARLIHYTSYRA